MGISAVVARGLVVADQICDYIPVLSSLSNAIVLLFQKYVCPGLAEETRKTHHYWQHITNKNEFRCKLLLIPVLGNLCAIIVDLGASSVPPSKVAPHTPVSTASPSRSILYQEKLFWLPVIEELPLQTTFVIHKQHEFWPPLHDLSVTLQNVDGQPAIEFRIKGSFTLHGAYGMDIKRGHDWLPIQDLPPEKRTPSIKGDPLISPFYLTPDRGVLQCKSSCLLDFKIMKDHPDFIQLDISEEGRELKSFFIDQIICYISQNRPLIA